MQPGIFFILVGPQGGGVNFGKVMIFFLDVLVGVCHKLISQHAVVE